MDPALPPKLVQPVQANAFPFEQALSEKINNSLVIKPIASKKVLHVTGSSTLDDPRETTHHLTSDKMPDPKLQVGSLLCNNETRTDASATAYDSIIIQGMKEKKLILSAYQGKFGGGHPDSIITKKKGQMADEILLTHTPMRSSLDKLYQMSELYLHNIIITVFKEHRATFSEEDISNI
jgi:hypothetical protein